MNKLIHSILLVSLCSPLLTNTQTNKKTSNTTKQKKSKTTEKTKSQKSTDTQKTKKAPRKIKISKLNPNREQWKPFLKSCSTSLVTGALIGALSGQACAYTNHYKCNYKNKIKKWCAIIINWFLWSAARQAIIEMIEEEMDTYHIKHNKTLIETTGFCTDKLSYIYAMYTFYK